MFSICSGLVLSSWIYRFSNNHHSNSLLYQTFNFCSSEELFDSLFRKQILKTEFFSKTDVSISPLRSNHLQQPPFIVLATGTVSKLSYFSKIFAERKKTSGSYRNQFSKSRLFWSAETECITEENCFACGVLSKMRFASFNLLTIICEIDVFVLMFTFPNKLV